MTNLDYISGLDSAREHILLDRKIFSAVDPLCCIDRWYGRTEPDPCSGLCDADILRASQLQHSVQHVGRDGHVWTTATVQGKNGRSATWSGAVMCSASKDAVRMTAGHDEFRRSGPNHLVAQCVPWPSRVFPIRLDRIAITSHFSLARRVSFLAELFGSGRLSYRRILVMA